MENCDLDLMGSNGIAAQPRPRIGLSHHDARAITAYCTGTPEQLAQLVEDARALAENLVLDGDATRARIEARLVASAIAHKRILETLLGECLRKRDFDGVLAVSKILDGVSKRVHSALRLMAMESAAKRRPIVSIGHANAVHFSDEGR